MIYRLPQLAIITSMMTMLAGSVPLQLMAATWTETTTSIYATNKSAYVGIGTTTPKQALNVTGDILLGTVAGTDGAHNDLEFAPDGGGTGAQIDYWQGGLYIANQNATTTHLSIKDDGKVGIGTTTPTEKFDIAGNFKTSGTAHINGRVGIGTNPNAIDNKVAIYQTSTGGGWALYTNSSSTDDKKGALIAVASNTAAKNTTGVFGITKGLGNSNGQPIGVRGDAESDNPPQGQFGVLGYNFARNQSTGMMGAGVWGGSVGKPGSEAEFTARANGVMGETYSKYNTSGGGIFYALSSTGEAEGVAAKTYSTDPDSFAVYASGKLGSSSTRVSLVNTKQQGPTELYSIDATEAWVEDYGEGIIKNGQTKINFDPLFLETIVIDRDNPFHIFIQTYNGSPVTIERYSDGFAVRNNESNNQPISFSYRIVAKRKHHENERLRKANVPIDQFMEPDMSMEELYNINKQWELSTDELDPKSLIPKQYADK